MRDGRRRGRRTVPPLDDLTPKGPAPTRPCDHPGCDREGEYRAPKDRDLREYHWFCLEHVQAYNRTWNYYAGMSQADMEEEIRQAAVGFRPTWRLGDRSAPGRGEGATGPDPRHFRDPFHFFDQDAEAAEAARRESRAPSHREDGPRSRAMRIMDLDEPLTLTELKARYKILVKRYHPDANGGDKDAEEHFKMVSEAYHLLVKALGA
jgi:hypothetical protein